MIRFLTVAAVIALTSAVAFSQAVLNPGFIAGTVRIGSTAETEIRSVQVGASSGQSPNLLTSQASFLSSPPANSVPYNLTVQVEEGGTRSYSTGATVRMDDGLDTLTFPRRSVTVADGATANLDFILDEPGFVQGTVTIVGGALSTARIDNSGQGILFDTSTKAALGGFYRVPVEPGTGIPIRAVITQSSGASVTLTETIDLAPGETVVVDFETPFVPTPTGSISGTLELSGPEPVINWSVATGNNLLQFDGGNMETYSLTRLPDGPRPVRATAKMSGAGQLNFPLSAFSSAFTPAHEAVIVGGSSEIVNVFAEQAFLTGTIGLSGSVSLEDLVANAISIRAEEALPTGNRGTSGGPIDPSTGDYRRVVTAGDDWSLQLITLKFLRTDPRFIDAGLTITTFEAQRDVVTLAPGESATRDLDLPTGTVTVNFSVAGGGTLSRPQLNGTCVRLDPITGEEVTRYTFRGDNPVTDVTEAAVTFVGLEGTCQVRARARVGGSFVTFGTFEVDVEPGVDKVLDIGAPILAVHFPDPEVCIDADEVTVRGLVTDDLAVVGVVVNGIDATLTSTNNSSDPVEATWEATIALPVKGPNLIVTVATDTEGKSATDTRTVFNDAGPPSLTWAPADGAITTASGIQVTGTATDDAGIASIEVNGVPVAFSATGNADNEVSFSTNVALTLGANVIEVVATDISTKSTPQVHTITMVVAICGDGTVDGAAGEVCDGGDCCTATCTFEPATSECRGAAGACDLAENCTGTSAACPADGFVPVREECRAAAGVCDVAESCSGTGAACPADAFAPASQECRASADICDVAESCSGSDAVCPADAFEPTTTECRADAGPCDVAETCPGTGAACPGDGFDPDGTTCDDAVVCTDVDVCTGGVCAGTLAVCGDGVRLPVCEECDDNNLTNEDGCDDQCSIEQGIACFPEPLTDCRTTLAGRQTPLLVLKNRDNDRSDQLKSKWFTGFAAPIAEEYGDPLTTTNYVICVYDTTGLRVQARAPADNLLGPCRDGPCWTKLGSGGFKYKDKDATPDGVRTLFLRGNRIGVLAKGVNLSLPADMTTLSQPVTVQIHNSEGFCFTAEYQAPARKQTVEQFKDKDKP